MRPLLKTLIVVNLVLLLGYVVYYVHQKETILQEGQLVLLELAPVDPRSLIQGDYMDLRYAVTDEWVHDSLAKTGYLVVRLDDEGVGQRQRFQAERTPLAPGEYLINYTTNRWSVYIGAESYFFQEGSAETYTAAKYGGLRVDDAGNSLLIGLYDAERNPLPGL